MRARLFARDRHAPILLEGESGTGKTLLARFLHHASPRANKPYQAVVLTTVEDSLAASELFGHVSGAYTDARSSRAGHFVSANGGTLFLDEIGKASLSVQQRLLHAVEYGEFRPVGSDRDMRVDIRIIAASNLKLEEQVARERFLPHLHARLCNFSLTMPSLRERRADIPMLANESVAKHAIRAGYTLAPEIDDELMAALICAPWPYNLRQLDATMHRVVLEADGDRVLRLIHCQDGLQHIRDCADRSVPLTPERVADAVQKAGTVSGAARVLGVHRATLHRYRREQESAPRIV